jgi:tyrosyl-DNA phosphodiesterase 2
VYILWNFLYVSENECFAALGKLLFLIRYSPDVVFLQEVIPPYCAYLKKRAASYTIITGNALLAT